MTNVNKKPQKYFFMCFDPVAAIFVITMTQRTYTFLTKSFICLTTFFQRLFGLINCNIFLREFISLKMVTIKIEKGIFLVIIAKVASRKKTFIKNLNVIDSNYHSKNLFD